MREFLSKFGLSLNKICGAVVVYGTESKIVLCNLTITTLFWKLNSFMPPIIAPCRSWVPHVDIFIVLWRVKKEREYSKK